MLLFGNGNNREPTGNCKGAYRVPVNKRYFSDLMKDRKVSLREVARRMEVWPAALSRSLDDKRKMQMEEAVQLARILSVPLAEVLVNAGIEQAVVTARRCSIIGHVHEGAEVERLGPDVIERVSIPDGISDDVVAVQNYTSETPAAYADGWITYLGPKMDPTDCLGMYSLVEVEGGSWMLGTIRRGYTPGTFNVFKPMRDQLKNVRIEWARRAIITVH